MRVEKGPYSDQAIVRYLNLMEEIKHRTNTISGILKTEIGPLQNKIAEEFCYLQLRMTCEVIAIACMILHEEFGPKKGAFRAYQPDKIMTEVEKLNPKFYPKPIENEDKISVEGPPEWVPRKNDFLTQKQLCELWKRHCGNKLHRGKVRQAFDLGPVNLKQVERWHSRIIGLLNRHIISTPDEKFILYVAMQSSSDGRVTSNLFQQVHH